MTTFIWNITRLDTRSDEANQNIIITAWFKITGIDGIYSAAYENGVGLSEVGDTFTPYSNLTEQQILQWCKDILGVEYCNTLEQTVQNKINLLKNTNITTLPWSNG